MRGLRLADWEIDVLLELDALYLAAMTPAAKPEPRKRAKK